LTARLKQLLFVIDEIGGIGRGKLKVVLKRNCTCRAGSLAVSTEDTAQHIDVEHAGIAIASGDALLVGVLVGLGARNRFVIKTKLTRVPTGSDLLAQLRRNVICEACLGLAVVAIVACLGITPPARGHVSDNVRYADYFFRLAI